MKKLLMNTFFKKELAHINKNFDSYFNREINLIKKNAQNEIEIVKTRGEIPHRIFFLFNNAEIIGIEKNKLEEEVYVFKSQYDSLLNIYLCSQSYQAINGLPRIMTSIDYDENNIKILDVQTEDIDRGNGAILMEYLIKTAKKMKVSTITGWLSSVDSDHFDRSEHYYKKFEFDVEFDDSRTSGSIHLKIR